MAITNLANTKWQFKNEPALSDLGTFAVNFTSNNTDYTSLTVTAERMKYGDDLAYGEPEPVYPVKGDLITMNVDGTDKQFRVLKNVSGTVYEVLALFTAASMTSDNLTYEGNNIDTYLVSTWYENLVLSAQNAIVSKTFRQSSWYVTANSGNPVYNAKANNFNYVISLANASYGNEITRKVYLLSIDDIIDYLEVTPQMSSDDSTLNNTNLWQMFWNDSSAHSSTYIALSSNGADYNTWTNMTGSNGSISGNGNTNVLVRPAFQIDLSKIDYTIST